MLQDLTKHGALGTSFVRRTIYILHGIGSGDVVWWLSFVSRCWWSGHGGCPWLGGSGGLPVVGLCGCYSLHGGLSYLRGPTSSSRLHVFLVLNSFDIGFVGLLS